MGTNFPGQGMGGMGGGMGGLFSNPWVFYSLLPYLLGGQMFGGQSPFAGLGQQPTLQGQSVQAPPSPPIAPPQTSATLTQPTIPTGPTAGTGQLPAPAPLPVNTALPGAPPAPPLAGGMPGAVPPAPSPLPPGVTPPAPGMPMGDQGRQMNTGREGGFDFGAAPGRDAPRGGADDPRL